MAIKRLIEGLPKTLPDLEEPCPIFILKKKLKLPEVQPLMSQDFPLCSCFIWICNFSMLKAYVDLLRHLWIYFLLLQTHLDFYLEATVHLLISL